MLCQRVRGPTRPGLQPDGGQSAAGGHGPLGAGGGLQAARQPPHRLVWAQVVMC